MPITPSPVATVLAQRKFTLRDLGHFLFPFLATFFSLWQASAFSLDKVAVIGALSGAAGVLFRKVFPNGEVPANARGQVLLDVLNEVKKQIAQYSADPKPVSTADVAHELDPTHDHDPVALAEAADRMGTAESTSSVSTPTPLPVGPVQVITPPVTPDPVPGVNEEVTLPESSHPELDSTLNATLHPTDQT